MSVNCIFKKEGDIEQVYIAPIQLEKLAASFFKNDLVLNKYCCPHIKNVEDFESLILKIAKQDDEHNALFLAEQYAKNTSVSKVIDRAYVLLEQNLFPKAKELEKALKQDAFMLMNDLSITPYVKFIKYLYSNNYTLVYNNIFI